MSRPRLVGFAFCQLLSDKKLYYLPAIPEKIAKFFVNDFLNIKLKRFFWNHSLGQLVTETTEPSTMNVLPLPAPFVEGQSSR